MGRVERLGRDEWVGGLRRGVKDWLGGGLGFGAPARVLGWGRE